MTWEKAKKFNFGVDTRLFRSQLELTADVFYERRSNILTNVDIVPGTYGGPAIQANAGIVENKGLESILLEVTILLPVTRLLRNLNLHRHMTICMLPDVV